MASNVELVIEKKEELINDPNYDSYTQRPRTPNIPYSNYSETQIKNIKQNRNTFFKYFSPVREIDYNKYKKRIVDFDYTSDQALCRSRDFHKASRPGAYIHWGEFPTPGDKICKHFHCESKEKFTEIDLYRRPPTNRLGGSITMKFGRPDRDYYAPKYPSSTTWFQSGCELNRCSTHGSNRSKSFAEFRSEKREDKSYIFNRMEKFPHISEYIDRFTLQTKTPRKLTNMEKRLAHLRGMA